MTTVYLSVSGSFSAGTQGALPLSRDRLLTIEWGVTGVFTTNNHIRVRPRMPRGQTQVRP